MKEIDLITTRIDALKEEIKIFEANPDDYEKGFDEMLDEVHGEFMGYSASYILKQVDPIAYRCGLLDYVDSLDITPPDEWDAELSDLLGDLEDLVDDKVEELNSLIKDLEQELEYLEDGDDSDAIQQDIKYAQADLKELDRIRKEYL